MTKKLRVIIKVKLTLNRSRQQIEASMTTLVGNCKHCQNVVTLTFGSGAVDGPRRVRSDLFTVLLELGQNIGTCV